MLHARNLQKRSRFGYTLTEILVVVAVIAVLTGLTFTMFASAARTVEGIEGKVAAVHSSEKLKEIKILPSSGKGAAAKTSVSGLIRDQYLIVLGGGDPDAEASRLATLGGGKVLRVYRNAVWGCSLYLPPAGLAAVRNDPAVRYIEQDQEFRLAVQVTPTGIRRSRIRKFFGGGSGTPFFGSGRQIANIGNVTVAVIDSGVDANHPDLNVVLSKGFGQPDVGDSDGHGTHVAGTIGAIENDEGVVGMVPGARIVNLRVFGPNPTTTTEVVAAVDYVTANANGIQVCNMSLGGGKSAIADAAVDACAAAGVTVVVAAGNDNANAAGYSPASAKGVICVAALADSDGFPGKLGPKTGAGDDDTFATFSNFGPDVEVIAPGVDILSTLPGNTYGLKSGTSMASPHVAGLAARIILLGNSSVPRQIANLKVGLGTGSGTGVAAGTRLSPEQVKQAILTTAVEVIPGRYDARGYRLINGNPWSY